MFCDVKDDPLYDASYDDSSEAAEDPVNLYGPLGLLDIDGPHPHPDEKETKRYWRTDSFSALMERPRTLLYVEVPVLDSGTLLGKIETHTARALNIVELQVDDPAADESDNGGA